MDGPLSYLGKGYNVSKLQNSKQSVEEKLIPRAVKTTIQALYDKGLFDGFQNADEVLKNFLFVTGLGGDLEESQ